MAAAHSASSTQHRRLAVSSSSGTTLDSSFAHMHSMLTWLMLCPAMLMVRPNSDTVEAPQ
jgi:hypothetical protein